MTVKALLDKRTGVSSGAVSGGSDQVEEDLKTQCGTDGTVIKSDVPVIGQDQFQAQPATKDPRTTRDKSVSFPPPPFLTTLASDWI